MQSGTALAPQIEWECVILASPSELPSVCTQVIFKQLSGALGQSKQSALEQEDFPL